MKKIKQMNKKQQIRKEFDEKVLFMEDAGFKIDYEMQDMAKQFIDTKITEILDEAMLKKQDKSFKRTEQEPTDDEKAYIDGYNKAIKEISEKIKSLGF
jgi:hypothetical protein